MFAEKYANMSNEKNCMISKCKKVKKKDGFRSSELFKYINQKHMT